MNKINLLKPDKKNLNIFLLLGLLFFSLGIFDFSLNNFYDKNITSFLPRFINFFTPLFFSVLGLHFIRVEYSGIKELDKLNKNINTNNFNACLSVSIILILIFSIPPLLNWFIFDANISGDTKESCTGGGACWVYIKVWFNRFMYGMYPNAEQWRINVTFILVLIFITAGFFAPPKLKKYLTAYYSIFLPILSFLLIYYLISGGEFGLEWVETGAWGGLSLTFIVSYFSLIFCFPIGMMLALGRRSNLPIVKYSSLTFIEFWRGVPLITVLFMSAVMFPMFLPDGTYIDKLIRVIVAIVLFEAAYTAEVIRGGLQALPRGQYDAAKSLGMGYWKLHLLVILPQALKLVIPGIANTFLALVKDTPLIFVVGLLELAGMLGLAKTNPKWLGFSMEGYVFAAIIFWIICYSMSRYSYNLEKKYKTDR
ncbi:MAG: amino acid ABC transporter permease [Candidatus Pelagibacter sp. TMED64]|nr:amino acid ABC transporter permease [Candidatus Pelagibacter sp.]OUU66088.1 MAG: amino acid ABC transporter permease [Candidatus Pelagibacter sp. TMED64]|tara:strand:+ start:225 stop:1496 length:1272 start_codon:yes stop_codon:yes gene_type:complete